MLKDETQSTGTEELYPVPALANTFVNFSVSQLAVLTNAFCALAG